MEALFKDLRYSVRMFFKYPGFTIVAVFMLALGIGANTAIFSLINAILLRPLPIEKPEQVVSVFPVGDKNSSGLAVFSYPNYEDFRNRNDVLSGLAVYRFSPLSLSRSGVNERVWSYMTSGNYFDVLGVKPFKGRFFSPEEDRTLNTHPVAVLSYACWQNRFGSDPDAIGKTIMLNGRSFAVIGIAPSGFNGTELVFAPELWAPSMMIPTIEPRGGLDKRGNGQWLAVGRLKPNLSAAQAEASLNNLAVQLGREHPQINEGVKIKLAPPGLVIPDLREGAIGFAGVLMAAVGLVLLIACTNLAGLLLSRSLLRRKEIAVRLALGASRSRLIRQLLTESMLLSILGGAAGLLIAFWITDLVMILIPPIDFSLIIDLKMDWRVLSFTLLLSLTTGMLFGLMPALQGTKQNIISALKDETSVGGWRRSRLRNFLVVMQVAMSLVLLIAAGLIVRSLQQMQKVGPGFQIDQAAAASVDLALQGYDEEKGRQFYRQLIERVESLPGVRSATVTNSLPLNLDLNGTGIHIEGEPEVRGANTPVSLYGSIGPNYFSTMVIPILEGRDFNQQDDKDSPRSAIVNETFAKRFWPGQSAVGKRFSFGGSEGTLTQVVGVAGNGKYFSLGEDPKPFVYLSMQQRYAGDGKLIVRTVGDPQNAIAAIRREVQQLDPNLPVFDVKTLEEHMGLSLFPLRVGALVVGSFGLLALLLSAIGIYGVMAHYVSGRAREIGIRMALGASRSDVLKLVVKQGMALAGIGLSIGLALSIALTRFMSSVLYGVSATDAATFAIVSFLLALVVFTACYIPAHRAMTVDPMIALRYE